MAKVKICPECECINVENTHRCISCGHFFISLDLYDEEKLETITKKKCPKCGTLNEDRLCCIDCNEELDDPSIESFRFRKDKSDNIKQENENENKNENSQENYSINATIIDTSEQNKRILELITSDSEILKIVPSKNILLGRSGNIKPELFASCRTVSREHLYIKFEKDQWFILDTKSLNGTYINGEKIDKDKQYKIKKGDKIALSTKFILIVRNI